MAAPFPQGQVWIEPDDAAPHEGPRRMISNRQPATCYHTPKFGSVFFHEFC